MVKIKDVIAGLQLIAAHIKEGDGECEVQVEHGLIMTGYGLSPQSLSGADYERLRGAGWRYSDEKAFWYLYIKERSERRVSGVSQRR